MSGGIGGGEGEGFDLSVKGQIHGYDTAQAAVNVGANDTIIYADSAQAAGIGYGASAKSTLATTGDLLAASSANTLSALTASATAGHVLTSTGAGSLPTYQAASGGLTATSVTDENFSGVYTGSSATLGANSLIYGVGLTWSFSSYKFLRCTALECKIGSATNGNFQLTLWGRNTVWGKSALLAWTHSVAQSRFGTNTIAKLETVGSAIIPSTKPTNTDIIICVHTDSASATFFNRGGTGVGAPLTFDDAAQYYVTTDAAMANSYSNPELKFYGEAYS